VRGSSNTRNGWKWNSILSLLKPSTHTSQDGITVGILLLLLLPLPLPHRISFDVHSFSAFVLLTLIPVRDGCWIGSITLTDICNPSIFLRGGLAHLVAVIESLELLKHQHPIRIARPKKYITVDRRLIFSKHTPSSQLTFKTSNAATISKQPVSYNFFGLFFSAPFTATVPL